MPAGSQSSLTRRLQRPSVPDVTTKNKLAQSKQRNFKQMGASLVLNSILSDFPANFSPRPIQREILREIDQRLSSGYKRIILSAPTGVGKSLIAGAIAQYCQSSFVVTASKHLQDQYTRDMNFLRPVKGKSNFPCLKLMQNETVKSSPRAMRLGLTCDKGQCVEKVSRDGKTVEETCRFKPKIKDIEKGVPEPDSCHYYLQKYEALVAPHSLWNYSAYFQIMRYNKQLFAEYLNRGIAVFDEAHRIEDQIIQFIGIDIYKGTIEECGINLDAYDLQDIDSIISLVDAMAEFYARRLREIESSPAFALKPDFDLVSKLESKFDRASRARVDLVEDRENFVINRPETDYTGGFKSLSVRPIDISEYVSKFFQIDLQMYMSATIDKDSFCENTGIDPGEVAVIDTPRSPFPIEHRRVDFLNVRRLNSRSTPEDKMAVIKKIDEIMTQHSEHRGLVLTSSISWCNEIKNGLSDENQKRIRICHSKNAGGITQDEILDEHAGVSNSVLLSSSLWEGVDLKDDLSRFQIIAKVPYPNLAERRVSEKMRRFPLWYDAQTLMKLLQGFGRSIRNDNDWARTYVLDSAAHHVLNKARQRIPRAYYDTLGWG